MFYGLINYNNLNGKVGYSEALGLTSIDVLNSHFPKRGQVMVQF